MIVLIGRNLKPQMRGEIGRYLLEVDAGVFVGHLSAQIREDLWKKVRESTAEGWVLLVGAARNEQGLDIRSHGRLDWQPVDFEGLTLIRILTSDARHTGRKAGKPMLEP